MRHRIRKAPHHANHGVRRHWSFEKFWRGTLQRILYSARGLMAEALVHGKGIRIQGGHYQLHRPGCACRAACQHCRLPHANENQENEGSQHE